MIRAKASTLCFSVLLLAILISGCIDKNLKTHKECLQEYTEKAEAIYTYFSGTDEEKQLKINKSVIATQECFKKAQDNFNPP